MRSPPRLTHTETDLSRSAGTKVAPGPVIRNRHKEKPWTRGLQSWSVPDEEETPVLQLSKNWKTKDAARFILCPALPWYQSQAWKCQQNPSCRELLSVFSYLWSESIKWKHPRNGVLGSGVKSCGALSGGESPLSSISGLHLPRVPHLRAGHWPASCSSVAVLLHREPSLATALSAGGVTWGLLPQCGQHCCKSPSGPVNLRVWRHGFKHPLGGLE